MDKTAAATDVKQTSLLDATEGDTGYDLPKDTKPDETKDSKADDPKKAAATEEPDEKLDAGLEDEGDPDEKATGDDQASKPAEHTGEDDVVMPPELGQRAVALGLTDADFEGVETIQEAERIVRLYERRVADFRPAPAKADDPKQQATEQAPDFPELKEDEHDPAVIQAFKAMKAQNDALRKDLENVNGHFAREQQKALWNEVQNWRGSLPDDWKSVLGDGKKDTPETQGALQKVLEQADVLAAGYASLGKQVPPTPVLMDQARDVVFASKAAELSARGLSKKLQTRRGGMLSRPTARRGSDQPRSEVSRVMSRLKEQGKLDPASASEDEF